METVEFLVQCGAAIVVLAVARRVLGKTITGIGKSVIRWATPHIRAELRRGRRAGRKGLFIYEGEAVAMPRAVTGYRRPASNDNLNA